MRAFTPDVESALRWFVWTHAIVLVPMVGARYERVSWPREGGAGDQDAWLTQALEQLRVVHNALLVEAAARNREKTPRAEKKRARG